MKFNDSAVQNLRNLELLIAVVEGNVIAYKRHLNYCALRGDKPAMEECAVNLNLYEKELNELNALKDDMYRKFNVMCTLMNDIQGRVFVLKFKEGMEYKDICKKLHISMPYLYKIIKHIEEILNDTQDGKDILTSLTE